MPKHRRKQNALGRHPRAGRRALAFLLLLSACVFDDHEAFDPNRPRLLPAAVLLPSPYFEPPHVPPAARLQHLEDDPEEAYRVTALSFPSVGENGQPGNRVTVRYYEGRGSDRKPLLVVLPIWGSFTYPSDKITEGLLEHYEGKANVMQVLGERRIFDWAALESAGSEEAFLGLMKQMAGRVRATVVDIRSLLRWGALRRDVDRQRIGLVGFSYGALVGALVLQHEQALGAAALLFGGAHPHSLIAKCPTEWTSRIQARVKKAYGWSRDDFEAKIETIFRPLDAASYPGRSNPSRILLVEAAFDDCMPDHSRRHFWEVLGQPERITVYDSHQGAFFAMTPLGFDWLPPRLFDFFDRRL